MLHFQHTIVEIMKRILIIEDNKEIRENLEEFLSLNNFEVFTSIDGEAGIKLIHETYPHLIICDISMPRKNGYEVFDEIKPYINKNNIPFVFLTANAQEKDKAKGNASGAQAYVVKPYNSNELILLIKQLLEKEGQ